MSSGDDPEGAASSSREEGAASPDSLSRPLPERVRSRVVEYGSDVLGSLPSSEVPAALRRVAKFEPRRRARLAGPQIAAQLESDSSFRSRVAQQVERFWPELVTRLREGEVPPAADPVAVAAAAYVVRPRGWAAVVERVHDELERQESAKEAAEAEDTIADLRRQLEESKTQHREETNRLRGELREQRRTIADLRRKMHSQRQRVREAEERAEQATARAQERSTEAENHANAVDAENRRLRNRVAAAEEQVENARRAARAGRSADDARLRVLLDVLLESAHGLRRELALPSSIDTPADLMAREQPQPEPERRSHGRPDDDPGVVDDLLALPRVHLLVDGYNVTKTGYPALPLADQRLRLVSSLEGITSQTKAEITCVFDGADVDPQPARSTARRIRLLFSDPEETADDLIIRLVRGEPTGRPLAVVTSDHEIVLAVRREGARTVPSALFLRWLTERG
ncbi:putative RNA-binding protein with PIN domain [Haloactinospora alba]|uniref:Putative RNA-binding protein with PIN domain n=1 Tax=Haloactinospora alba TaxID=405555 RepID=A0A543NJM4_9ACTN|nr:NYN domain-containing protein [Haloactinospora alba]TQN32019.1 putative RNA-binding protein with PIN domain [Haloactinospora alba]